MASLIVWCTRFGTPFGRPAGLPLWPGLNDARVARRRVGGCSGDVLCCNSITVRFCHRVAVTARPSSSTLPDELGDEPSGMRDRPQPVREKADHKRERSECDRSPQKPCQSECKKFHFRVLLECVPAHSALLRNSAGFRVLSLPVPLGSESKSRTQSSAPRYTGGAPPSAPACTRTGESIARACESKAPKVCALPHRPHSGRVAIFSLRSVRHITQNPSHARRGGGSGRRTK